MNKKSKIILFVAFSILFSALTACAVSYWSQGDFWIGWRGAFLLCLPFSLLMILAWNWAGHGKMLAVMIFCAFALRLGGGLAVQNLLPLYGHPGERREELGFLFDDAWRRDEESWAIAEKEEISFPETLTREYHNDQYGGMVAMGVWLYEYLSPDARRFSFLFMLGAFFTAIGLPFFWKGVLDRCGSRIAFIAGWVFALYPDSIFYSSASMREPFLIGILAVAFWALCLMRTQTKKSILVLALCFLATLPFSSMVGAALLAVSLLWFWAETLIPRGRKWLWGGIILMVIGFLTATIVAMPAFQEWIHYDIHTTENGSGWVEKVVGEIGGQFRAVFVAFYGITQPVLPAILVYPVAPACVLGVDKCTTVFWKAAGIFRAAGWYLMVPFLFYALFSTLRVRDRKEKALLVVNAIFVLAWIFISSLRAGGDQWDNPRYRVIFLPWLAFFCAWGIDFALKLKDWWLVRWIAIELVFLFFFTQWYVSRYGADIIRRFPFWKTVVYIIVCSGLIFATGLITPIRKRLGKAGEKYASGK